MLIKVNANKNVQMKTKYSGQKNKLRIKFKNTSEQYSSCHSVIHYQKNGYFFLYLYKPTCLRAEIVKPLYHGNNNNNDKNNNSNDNNNGDNNNTL